MPEYTRELFIANGKLLPVDGFGEFFSPDLHYVYEVFRIIDAIPLFIEDHLDRFFHTTLLAGVDAGCDREHLFNEIQTLISANKGGEGNIKISIVPGKSGFQNLLLYFTPHQYPTPEQFAKGVAVKLLDAERKNPNAKVMDITLRAETDQIKQADEVYEVLLVDQDGYITEGSRSNVFFIFGDEVITPPLEMVLPGVTRKHVMHLCETHNIRLSEQKVHRDDLFKVDSLFLSGTSRKVLPILRLDESIYPINNELLRSLMRLFNQHVLDYISTHRN
jgi:branched-chain amino acid aminotransferase